MKTFEEKLKRLEAINNQIKGGEVNLETSLKLFEEGIGLAKTMEKELTKAERKVEYLLEDNENPNEDETSEDETSEDDASVVDAPENLSEKTRSGHEAKNGGGRKKREISAADDDRNLKLFEDDEVSKTPSTGDNDHE
ncbi:MAG: exodeoxyribonuclease VII small subunit [Spirochaetales bacterium]|nr:exodeoxyribonuclease VII small subunit [Spirochaetales bacterium]